MKFLTGLAAALVLACAPMAGAGAKAPISKAEISDALTTEGYAVRNYGPDKLAVTVDGQVIMIVVDGPDGDISYITWISGLTIQQVGHPFLSAFNRDVKFGRAYVDNDGDITLQMDRNASVALAIGRPAVHLVMPQGLGSGTPLIQHGRHGQADSTAGAALVAECGQHFLRSTSELAVEVALDFIGHCGLIERAPAVPASQQRFELLQTCMVKTGQFRFARPLVGFETFAQGELVATDGAEELRAPCDHCTVLMPTRQPVVGREAVYLARPLA